MRTNAWLALPLACTLAACGGAASSDLLDGDAAVPKTPADAGTGSHDSGSTADAHPDAQGGDPGVHCPNSGYCQVPGRVCCTTDQGDSCTTTGSCPGLSIPCDDTADCEAAGMAGKVCCLVNGLNGKASSVQCLSASDCLPSMGRTRLCNPQVAGSCPSGQACLPSQQSLPGFDICR